MFSNDLTFQVMTESEKELEVVLLVNKKEFDNFDTLHFVVVYFLVFACYLKSLFLNHDKTIDQVWL